MTKIKSYEGVIRRKNINKELAWNNDLMTRLENALSGKSNNLVTNIEDRGYGNNFLVIAVEL